MIVKNKILDKILKIYFSIFALFSFLSVNIVLMNIFNHFNILNSFTGCIVLVITIFSFAGVTIIIGEEWNENKGR